MKRKNKAKGIFLKVSLALLVILGIVRLCCPGVMDRVRGDLDGLESMAKDSSLNVKDSVHRGLIDKYYTNIVLNPRVDSVYSLSKMEEKPKHPVKSVIDYDVCFPDSQPVQLAAATRLGISRVPANRNDVEKLKKEVCFVGASPYYELATNMTSSVPFMVPEASDLLQRIGRNFMDSLAVKNLPMNKLVISSIWRTEADVRKLQHGNMNATTRSCHMFGTTFDISYNKYIPVETEYGPRWSRSACWKMKLVLAEVLRDLRDRGYCYVKHEVHQPCFHITVR